MKVTHSCGRYCSNYDAFDCAFPWAKESLLLHAKDKREHVYTYQQFEQALTHDALWNAAQRQMVVEGKMHGFLRMYWAKKILEWSSSPQEALAIGIKLNDRSRATLCVRRFLPLTHNIVQVFLGRPRSEWVRGCCMVHTWHTRHGLGRARRVRQDPLHEL